MNLVEPGDEVIVPEPMYVTYEATIQAPGARIGLRVQRADDTTTVDPADFLDTGLTPATPPRFGGVLPRGRHPVQQVLPEHLLSAAVRESLFSGASPA